MDNALLNDELPDDAVEMVRAIRNRHYEETKYMTREDKRAHDSARMAKSVAEFKKLMKEVNLNDYDFSWLRKKS